MDLSKPKALKALEAVLELGSFSQYRVWKKAGTSFATAHNLVHYLEEKRVVAKAGKEYKITTWPGLLGLFAAYRTFPKPLVTLQLSIGLKEAEKYVDSKGFIRCLTSAWKYYDDYLLDPQLHVYAPSQKMVDEALAELSQLPKGTLLIHVYPQDLVVSPAKRGSVLVTGLQRTLLDLYSSHYAYATDNWIKKKANR